MDVNSLDSNELLGVSFGAKLSAYANTLINTAMRIIKLNLFPVPVRLHSGFGKSKFRRYLTSFCDISER